jgi:hypothetical protein
MSAAKKSKVDDEAARTRGQEETLLLVAEMERELVALLSFVAEEKRSAKRKSPSPKRVARLRLVSEDIASAARLSTKAVKS